MSDFKWILTLVFLAVVGLLVLFSAVFWIRASLQPAWFVRVTERAKRTSHVGKTPFFLWSVSSGGFLFLLTMFSFFAAGCFELFSFVPEAKRESAAVFIALVLFFYTMYLFVRFGLIWGEYMQYRAREHANWYCRNAIEWDRYKVEKEIAACLKRLGELPSLYDEASITNKLHQERLNTNEIIENLRYILQVRDVYRDYLQEREERD